MAACAVRVTEATVALEARGLLDTLKRDDVWMTVRISDAGRAALTNKETGS